MFLPSPYTYEPTTNYPISFASFDTAEVLTNAIPAIGVSEISEWTRQNDPGDTMALSAESLDANFAAFFAYSESGTYQCDIPLIDGRMAAVTLPDALPANDMYLLY